MKKGEGINNVKQYQIRKQKQLEQLKYTPYQEKQIRLNSEIYDIELADQMEGWAG